MRWHTRAEEFLVNLIIYFSAIVGGVAAWHHTQNWVGGIALAGVVVCVSYRLWKKS